MVNLEYSVDGSYKIRLRMHVGAMTIIMEAHTVCVVTKARA